MHLVGQRFQWSFFQRIKVKSAGYVPSVFPLALLLAHSIFGGVQKSFPGTWIGLRVETAVLGHIAVAFARLPFAVDYSLLAISFLVETLALSGDADRALNVTPRFAVSLSLIVSASCRSQGRGLTGTISDVG